MINILVCGIYGRMGQALVKACDADNTTSIVGGTARSTKKYGAVHCPVFLNVSEAVHGTTQPQIILDFTLNGSVESNLKDALKAKLPLVIGVTDLLPETHQKMERAAKQIPILYAPNTSLGANLLIELSKIASKALPDHDIEILEAHHKHKQDSPSGLAVALAESLSKDRNSTINLDRRKKERQAGEIGVVSLRGGGLTGEHTTCFLGELDRFEIRHQTNSREIFAKGALTAAKYLLTKNPGLYSMKDVLGL